jgi:hypothetical protein
MAWVVSVGSFVGGDCRYETHGEFRLTMELHLWLTEGEVASLSELCGVILLISPAPEAGFEGKQCYLRYIRAENKAQIQSVFLSQVRSCYFWPRCSHIGN